MKGKQLTTAILLCLPGVTFFNILPVYLGAVSEEFGLGPDKIGYLSAIEMGALALASLLGPFWIRRFDWRKLAVFVILVMLAGNLLTLVVESYETLLIVRMLTGLFGEGIAYTLAVAAVSESEKPDRGFALLAMAQVTAGAIGLFCLPGLIAIWGMAPVLLYLILLALVVLPLLKWMPVQSAKMQMQQTGQLAFPVYIPLIGLSVLAIWCLNLGAFWGFVERIGDAAGMDGQTIGIALGLGMLAGIPGSAAAAWMSDKHGRIWPFCVTLFAHAVLMYPLITALTGMKLALIMISYNLTWNFGMPYLMGLIATSDSSARMAVLMPVSMSLGVGLGSAFAGILASQHGFASISLFAAGCCLIAMFLFVTFGLRIVHGNWFSTR